MKNIAGVDMDQLASGSVRMLAEHAKACASDILARLAPLALPAAKRGEDDDLVTRPPRRIR